MDQITIGQISMVIAFIVALWKGLDFIADKGKLSIKKQLEDVLKPTNEKIDKLDKKMDDVDLNSTKNFLVSCMDDIKNKESHDPIILERFWEQYEHYIKLGGNSYIKNEVEKLKKEGKI